MKKQSYNIIAVYFSSVLLDITADIRLVEQYISAVNPRYIESGSVGDVS